MTIIGLDDFKSFASGVIKEVIMSTLKSEAPTNETNNEALKTRKQMAKELDISLVTLNEWKNDGLPYRRLHRRIYFLKSEVLEYMYSNHKRIKKG